MSVIWKAKKKFDDLSAAFKGLNNNKNNFYERYLQEVSINTATVRNIADLREEAATAFSSTLTKAATLPIQESSKMQTLESHEILTKKIIGKADVDIAALIEKLGNSDWVQQGRQYFEQLNDQCPFCQQDTDVGFRQRLEDYFDQSYIADLKSVDDLLTDYRELTKKLLGAFGASDIVNSPHLDGKAYAKDMDALRLELEANVKRIAAKKNEPSTPVTLIDTVPKFAAMEDHIRAANKKVTANNDIIDNLAARKNELISQIWKRLLEDTNLIYQKFKSERDSLDAAIKSLVKKLETSKSELEAKLAEIKENEHKLTSIKPAVNAINLLLQSFGFTNFHLMEGAESGFYEIKRPDGSDAKRTLSEGEKSFITFLYFYHLVKGSFNSSGSTNDKVVVFDDPVSSLDADILFIVANLIKNVITEMRTGTSPIKQVFVLTHNVYFHKEVTFDKKRSLGKAKADETFWVVRKASKRSELISFEENPIKSSYELLWREIRQKPPSDTAIQNVMRRILEHYFKFYGGISTEKIIEKFDGKDKMICSSLLSWVNDGSHFAIDDLYMACDSGQVDRYLGVFQRIFEESDHGGHFKMMMAEDYVALPVVNKAEAG
ncbi:MAG: AAA family ATPase [Anaerolineales bacterium]|nr:AAA family ATPase [Alphaproteobacteria bacterium]MCW5886779.1 AAA family ATPase [Anaerolineales bacterium]